MSFNPKQVYSIERTVYRLRDFHDYHDDYVTRPPYQRKSVWSKNKKQALMDSLVRKYYVPDVVLREVRLSDQKTVSEVIDGQQRITTVQAFYQGEFALPNSLKDVAPDIAGKKYNDLDVDYRKYLDQLNIQVDLIKGIDEKENVNHQVIATEIFWRLQLGESLNTMEVAHARLASKVRNFLVKYSDDITFDFENYSAIDDNSDKHPFFKIMWRNNNRMEHLATLARMVLIEEEGGFTDLKDSAIMDLIEKSQSNDGIGSLDFENEKSAKAILKNLDSCFKVFEGSDELEDPGASYVLNREYFVLSFYMLVRHLRAHYVLGADEFNLLYEFIWAFHDRWRSGDDEDTSMLHFSSNRQQGAKELAERDLVIRQAFFEFAAEQNAVLRLIDTKRAFSEKQRIDLYRRDKGLCKVCLENGVPEAEAKVSWSDYQADHIFPWSKGGDTELENGQVLCSVHNQQKSNN